VNLFHIGNSFSGDSFKCTSIRERVMKFVVFMVNLFLVINF